MITQGLSRVLVLGLAGLLLVATSASNVHAETIFFDDFSDGDIQNGEPVTRDGIPVRWDPILPQFPGTYVASSGDFQLIPPSGGATFDFMGAMARDLIFGDISIRAQLRKLQQNPGDTENIGVMARINPVDPSLPASAYSMYRVTLVRNGDLVIGFLNTPLQSMNIGLDPTVEDVLLQFDLFGDTLGARAWRLGEPMPTSPQVEITDSTYSAGGIVLFSTDGPGDSIGVFRFVQVADAPIPPGDFNYDGLWDCIDLNTLSAAIASESTDLVFDLNGDDSVTLEDITDPDDGWLVVGGANNASATAGNRFLNADANLDGTVDGQDFIIWNTSKFQEIDQWCEGDWNADGTVDGQDFLIWNGAKFTSSNAFIDANQGAVPEPSSAMVMLGYIVGLMMWAREESK